MIFLFCEARCFGMLVFFFFFGCDKYKNTSLDFIGWIFDGLPYLLHVKMPVSEFEFGVVTLMRGDMELGLRKDASGFF